MFSLIQIEISKIFSRRRSYIGFLAIFIIVSILQLAMRVGGPVMINMMMQNIKDSFVFEGNLMNGYFVSFMLMNSLWVLLPFLVTFIAGDSIAGEAHAGTLRILLTRPVSRNRLITAKFFTSVLYTFTLVLFLAIVGLGVSLLLFGTGDLIVFRSTLNIFPESVVLPRFIFAFSFAFLGMTVVTSLAFLLSTLTNNAIGPIIGTMAIVLGFTIITNLNLEVFHTVRMFLFTTYISSWSLFFDYTPDWHQVGLSVLVCLLHIIVFFFSALWIFNRKDILT